jgi:biopolymer transport protein ExbD
MDVLTLLLVFLLATVGEDAFLGVGESVDLPVSSARREARGGVDLVLTDDQFLLDGGLVVDLRGQPLHLTEEEADLVFEPLAVELAGRRERSLATDAGLELRLQADRQVPYARVEAVMRVARRAGYKEFQLLVMRRE